MAFFSFLDNLNLIENDASQYEVGISDEGFSYLDMGSEKKVQKLTFADKQARESGAALDGSTRARGQSNLKKSETIDHDEICFDTDLKAIIRDIEDRRNKISVFPLILGVSMVLVAIWLYLIFNLSMPFLGFILSGFIVVPSLAFVLVNSWFYDRSRKDVHFKYNITGSGEVAYERLNLALENVNASGQVLLYSGRQHFEDSRYSGGAATLPEFKEVACDLENPPLLEIPFKVWHLRVFNRDLYFMPDHILVYDGANMGGVNYGHLEIDTDSEVVQTRGIAKLTGDAKVVGRTFRFVNNDGSPDQRFNNNIEIPLIEYGILKLKGSGLDISLYVTDQKSVFEAPDRFSSITELARKPVLKIAEQRRLEAVTRRKAKQEKIYSIVLDAMICVMFADGEASEAEQAKIHMLMQKIRSPWSENEINSQIQSFHRRVKSKGIDAIVSSICSQVSMIEGEKQQLAFKKCLSQVMAADGRVHPKSANVRHAFVSAIQSRSNPVGESSS